MLCYAMLCFLCYIMLCYVIVYTRLKIEYDAIVTTRQAREIARSTFPAIFNSSMYGNPCIYTKTQQNDRTESTN